MKNIFGLYILFVIICGSASASTAADNESKEIQNYELISSSQLLEENCLGTALGNPLMTYLKLKFQYSDIYFNSNQSLTSTWTEKLVDAPVRAYNEIEIDAPVEIVFQQMIQAASWPDWYINSGCVSADELALGTEFSWVTFGIHIKTKVVEFEKNKKMIWLGQGTGTVAEHQWYFESSGPSTTKVITEERDSGFKPHLLKISLNKGLHASHQIWLESLKNRSEALRRNK